MTKFINCKINGRAVPERAIWALKLAMDHKGLNDTSKYSTENGKLIKRETFTYWVYSDKKFHTIETEVEIKRE